MKDVIDNGIQTPPKVPGEWTPILSGEIFCSPACGGKCKKKDFDEATERARALASHLGYGWEPHVWENLGWHFEAKKREATVTVVEGSQYEASIRFYMDRDGLNEVYLAETRDSPVQAVEAVVDVLNARIKALQRALVAVSPDPLQIAAPASLAEQG